MVATVRIPRTVEDASSNLASLDALVTAKQWSRAAIVYAFTEPDAGHGGRQTAESGRLSCRAFAALGISGLRSKATVAAYQQTWATAVENGWTEPAEPGARVNLPDVEWPGRQDDVGKRRYAERTPESFSRSLARGDVEIDAFAQDLDDDTAAAIVSRIAEDRPHIAAPAVAAHDIAREAVEDAGIRRRAADRPDPLGGRSPEEEGRSAERGMNQAVGDPDSDLVISYLRDAAKAIVEAIDVREQFDVDVDPAKEDRMLARIDRALNAYRGETPLTDDDRAFLAKIGVEA